MSVITNADKENGEYIVYEGDDEMFSLRITPGTPPLVGSYRMVLFYINNQKFSLATNYAYIQ
jgi:hypothetical protein